jgi:glycosyltransferase involved in cell wall biosynthesis
MRVLHVLNEINFSGAEIMYAGAAEQFQKSGFELIALSTGKNIGNFVKQFEEVNIKIYHKPFARHVRNPFKIIAYFKDIINFINDNNIDIIHVHRSDVYWQFSLCSKLTGRKAIATCHNVFKNRKITWFKAYLERLSARKLFNLTFQTIGESVYINELNYYKNPSIKINNWFNAHKFYPAIDNHEKDLLRKKIGLNKDDFIIISTGSCSEIKNHSDIIKALPIVLKQINCYYLHLGVGAIECDEKKLVNDLNLNQHVSFLGNIVNVRDYLVAADVFIMPSKYEGLSIASIEAMACRLPSILYNSQGLRDLIKNDDNGFLIDHDYKLLAEKIIFLNENQDVSKRMAENAWKFVNSDFSMINSVSEIIKLYLI